MIEVRGLSKRYGEKLAVDDVTFTVQPGKVTGYLGPNGSGKSTTLRVILGLDQPTSGVALVAGVPYRDHARPLRSVGALLDASEVHPSRTAAAHLRALAATAGSGVGRVHEVLQTVGLSEVAHRRVGTLSLGMKQRLGIAAALLGDPEVLVLDEPVNGLDPDGVAWIRRLMRSFADQGRTVFVSSHLMSEMAQTADQVIVVGRGRLLADVRTVDLLTSSVPRVVLRTERPADVVPVVERAGGTVDRRDGDRLEVTGVDARTVAALALHHRIALHELTTRTRTLEEAFMELTRSELEHQASGRPVSRAGAPVS